MSDLEVVVVVGGDGGVWGVGVCWGAIVGEDEEDTSVKLKDEAVGRFLEFF